MTRWAWLCVAAIIAGCPAKPDPASWPGDPVLYKALEGQPGDHGQVARWAHQFMTYHTASDILERRGYRCGGASPLHAEVRCVYARDDDFWPGELRVDLRVEGQQLRGAKGYRWGPGWETGRSYAEVVAPGIEFAEPQTLAEWVARAIQPAHTRFSDIMARMRQFGFKCAFLPIARPDQPTVTLACDNRSFSGQAQAVRLVAAVDDLVLRSVEALVGKDSFSVAVKGVPPTHGGSHELLLSDRGGAWDVLLLEPPSEREEAARWEATVARIDDASRARLVRATAGQLDAAAHGGDGAFRPALQRIEQGALRFRRLGALPPDAREIAKDASIETYAGVALADCDARHPAEARRCADAYAEVRPELRRLLAAAVEEALPAGMKLPPSHPAIERLQRTAALVR